MAKVTKSFSESMLRKLRRELAGRGLEGPAIVPESIEAMQVILEKVLDETNKSVGYPRPVCPECHVELKLDTIGVGVLDMASFGPYQLWASDLWRCPKCEAGVILEFGNNPVASHYDPDDKLGVESQRYQAQGLLYESR